MAVPYQPIPASLSEGRVAFVDVLEIDGQLHGGLLVIDGVGRPIEFVHNTLTLPSGPWWFSRRRPGLLLPALVRTLFDACGGEPDLVVLAGELGSVEECRREYAPAIPCCRLTRSGGEVDWAWINTPPGEEMRAAGLVAALCDRALLDEPFERLRQGLLELAGETTDAAVP